MFIAAYMYLYTCVYIYIIDWEYYCTLLNYHALTCTLQELVRELGDGAFTGTLAADSSNVVTLVRDLYNVSTKLLISILYYSIIRIIHMHTLYTCTCISDMHMKGINIMFK